MASAAVLPVHALPGAMDAWEQFYIASMSAHNAIGASGPWARGCALCHVGTATVLTTTRLNAYGNAFRNQMPIPRPSPVTPDMRKQWLKNIEALASVSPAGTSFLTEIQHDTQPGWRAGAANSVYEFISQSTQPAVLISTTATAPSGIIGTLDYLVAPAITSAPPISPTRILSSYVHTFTATGLPAPTFSISSGALPSGSTSTRTER